MIKERRLTPEEQTRLDEFVEEQYLPNQSFRLVVPSFPLGKLIPRKEWLEIRQAIFKAYQERKEENSERNRTLLS